MFDLQIFARALTATLPAASTDDTRPHLAGIAIKRIPAETDMPRSNPAPFDRFVAVATDGHRLHMGEIPTTPPARIPEVRLPIATVKAVIKLARERRKVAGVTVVLDVNPDGRTGTVRVSDGGAIPFTPTVGVDDFPPYAKVIPGAFNRTGCRYGINARYLSDAAECAAMYCRAGKVEGAATIESGSNPLDPVVALPSNPEAHFVAVVMPMRID